MVVTGSSWVSIPKTFLLGVNKDRWPSATTGATDVAEYQVQRSGLGVDNWKTIARGSELEAREIFSRQLRLYSVGRFRLLDADGKVVEEKKASPLFSNN